MKGGSVAVLPLYCLGNFESCIENSQDSSLHSKGQSAN